MRMTKVKSLSIIKSDDKNNDENNENNENEEEHEANPQFKKERCENPDNTDKIYFLQERKNKSRHAGIELFYATETTSKTDSILCSLCDFAVVCRLSNKRKKAEGRVALKKHIDHAHKSKSAFNKN